MSDLTLHNAAIARLEAELAASEVRERQHKQSYVELERMYQAAIQDKQRAERARNRAIVETVTKFAATHQDLRPEVRAFAGLMEARLRENDHKPGWKYDSAQDLLYRLQQETDELAFEIHGPTQAVAQEAADVGNFAMMIADVCGWLLTDLPTTTNPFTLVPIEDERAAVLCEQAAARLRRQSIGNAAAEIVARAAIDAEREARETA